MADSSSGLKQNWFWSGQIRKTSLAHTWRLEVTVVKSQSTSFDRAKNWVQNWVQSRGSELTQLTELRAFI